MKFILPLYNPESDEASYVYVKCYEIISTKDTYIHDNDEAITVLTIEKPNSSGYYTDIVTLSGHLSETIRKSMVSERFITIN